MHQKALHYAVLQTIMNSFKCTPKNALIQNDKIHSSIFFLSLTHNQLLGSDLITPHPISCQRCPPHMRALQQTRLLGSGLITPHPISCQRCPPNMRALPLPDARACMTFAYLRDRANLVHNHEYMTIAQTFFYQIHIFH